MNQWFDRFTHRSGFLNYGYYTFYFEDEEYGIDVVLMSPSDRSNPLNTSQATQELGEGRTTCVGVLATSS
jgi:hypothetical protein